MMLPMLDRSSPLRLRSLLVALAILGGLPAAAEAAPKKKFHFELAAVTPKPEVKADVAKAAVPRVEAQVKKAFESHPQLVAQLEGAPEKGKVDAYRKYLARKGLSGAFLVTVELTEATEELVPMDKPNSQRFVVSISVHVLGETIPGRTMGFTGDGRATVKQEIGKRLRPRDREVTWEQAAEVAIADALATVFKQLEKPQKR